VTAHLELRLPGEPGSRVVVLDHDRLTVGRDTENDVALPGDPKLSRVHAAFERYGQGWAVNDLGSRNGTFVNNQRLWQERILRPGDEVKAGSTLLVFRTGGPGEATADPTEGGTGVLRVTPREYEVLAALCAPLLEGELFTEPASTREIADGLVITEAAVKQHLLHLYDKLGVHESDRRRARLANEAFRRGLLSQADLRAWAQRKRP
jgi:pSer/pThr/pTyr-binding forkhead associated (FHA) protein